ncbi:MAG TPA: site-specific integrase, partial [Sphingomonadales bacterium]
PETGKPSIRKAELTVEDERRVYEYCDQRRADSKRGQQWWLFKQFIMWQIDTGMRKCETLLIDLDRVRHNIVQIRVSKNGEGRDVPLTSRLIKMVDIFRAMDHKGPLFAGLTFGKIQEMWDECRRALDLGDLVIHDLRHTRGQRLCDAGVPLEVVSELLGHKDIGVTGRVYTIRKTAALQQWAKFAEENPDAALTGEFQLKVVS